VIEVLATKAEVAARAADLFVEEARSVLAGAAPFFSVALAGGTTFAEAYRLLASAPRREAVDWARVHIFFGDERCVPEGHADRNDRAAREALLDHVPIPFANVHTIAATSADAAGGYESGLRAALGASVAAVPRLDLILLGMGPDGHTASLFPDHAALRANERLVVRIAGAPKPPPERITFTLPLLNAARCLVFAATGADKRQAAARAIAGDESVPAGRVRPSQGRLIWLLDEAAGGGLR